MIDLLLDLSTRSEFKWGISLFIIYFLGTQLLINFLIGLSLLFLIVGTSGATYIIYKLKKCDPIKRDEFLNYMIDVIKMGVSRRLFFEDIKLFCTYIYYL